MNLLHSTLYIYVVKPECTTERVDDNLWKIIFTTSSLQDSNVTLTKPVLDRTEVSPLIEDNIEDGHDANHGVERGQSSHWG